MSLSSLSKLNVSASHSISWDAPVFLNCGVSCWRRAIVACCKGYNVISQKAWEERLNKSSGIILYFSWIGFIFDITVQETAEKKVGFVNRKEFSLSTLLKCSHQGLGLRFALQKEQRIDKAPGLSL